MQESHIFLRHPCTILEEDSLSRGQTARRKKLHSEVSRVLSFHPSLLTQAAPPEECAKSIIDNALKSSPSSCQWTAYGGWQTWLVSKFLWYNATVSPKFAWQIISNNDLQDIMLKAMGFPNLKRAILGNDKDR